MKKEDIALITCEASLDPETAFELGRDWGVKHFELRQVFSPETRVPYFSSQEKEYLKSNLKRYGGDIVAISPGLFIRCEATEGNAKGELKDKLPQSLRFCEEFNVKNMIVFSFEKKAGVSIEWVIDKLGQATQMAEKEGVTLYLEPEIYHYGNDGESMVQIIKGVNSKNLRVNWDPANIYSAGKVSYPEQFEHVKDLIGYVHLKDCVKMSSGQSEGPLWTVLGKGKVRWKEQLKALQDIGYSGYLSIETHTFYNKIKTTKENFDVLNQWIYQIKKDV